MILQAQSVQELVHVHAITETLFARGVAVLRADVFGADRNPSGGGGALCRVVFPWPSDVREDRCASHHRTFPSARRLATASRARVRAVESLGKLLEEDDVRVVAHRVW